jgi:hypothetical protein
MQTHTNTISRPSSFVWLITIAFSFLLIAKPAAHPMPNSVVLLDIRSDRVNAELQLPLNELELAYGHDVNRSSDQLVERLGPELKKYILAHVHPLGADGKPWAVFMEHMVVQPVQNSDSGPYKELTVYLSLVPPAGSSTRKFSLNYDVIIHQVVSHFALVSVRKDWDNGMNEDYVYQVGVLRLDVPSNQILPLNINIREGSLWIGFKSMLSLGMEHIKEGTDHLLFLMVLLLPAPLLLSGSQWGKFGGIKFSLIKIMKVVTAFTIGHSITLLTGATGLLHFSGQPVEILIALSILVSAIHALKPVFPGKEMYIAAGFGLIHGMAFADTLANLSLDGGRMALSILGFNLGIELMQLFIIALTIPWLIILSISNKYTILRTTGAIVAIAASLGWIAERITGDANLVTKVVGDLAAHSCWLTVILALAAACSAVSPLRIIFSLRIKRHRAGE